MANTGQICWSFGARKVEYLRLLANLPKIGERILEKIGIGHQSPLFPLRVDLQKQPSIEIVYGSPSKPVPLDRGFGIFIGPQSVRRGN